MEKTTILDWVFKIPHEYTGCELSEDACESIATKVHEFNRYVDAINNLTVTCIEASTSNELPDWAWNVAGKNVIDLYSKCQKLLFYFL